MTLTRVIGGIGNVSVVVQHYYGTLESPDCDAVSYEITGMKNVTIKLRGGYAGSLDFCYGGQRTRVAGGRKRWGLEKRDHLEMKVSVGGGEIG
jgi:hypothetical protein